MANQNNNPLTNRIVPTMRNINYVNSLTGRDINAVGVHAAQPFATPKYAKHRPDRHHEFEDTMARLFVQVPQSLYKNFLESITDSESAEIARVLAGTGKKPGGYGYIDFLLQRAHHALNDKHQVVETLSDSYVAFFFGLQAPVFNYSGVLLNTFQDDWAMRMLRIFNEFGRGTELAKRGFILRLRYDSMIVNGAMTNFTWDLSSDSETGVPFSFNILVKSVQIIYDGLAPPTNLKEMGFDTFEPPGEGTLLVSGSGEAAQSLIGGASVKPAGVSDASADAGLTAEIESGGQTQNFDSPTGQSGSNAGEFSNLGQTRE